MPKRKQSCYSYVEDWRSMWKPNLEAIAYNGASCDPTRVHPKVLQWAKQNCSPHTPHFVKIINQNACLNGRRSGLKNASDCQLSVPWPFVREHFRELGRVVTLENDEGTTWRVSFGSSAKARGPSWKQGWSRVATENKFEPGEVIVFILVADSRFRFTRFDEHGNLITKSAQFEHLDAIKRQCTTFKLPCGRTSWKEKRAAAVASRADQGAQASGATSDHRHGHETPQRLKEFMEQRMEWYYGLWAWCRGDHKETNLDTGNLFLTSKFDLELLDDGEEYNGLLHYISNDECDFDGEPFL